MKPPGRAWTALAALLALGALAAWWCPAPLIDWQPALAAHEPWRAWSGAFVHWSALHLGANLAGCAAVALLGALAPLPAQAALAWFLAWPLTQLGLFVRPDLAHYGGLSGVLHAGAAVAALWLAVTARGARRAVGAALGAGVLAKLLFEAPWGPTLRHGGGWDIAVAPVAHASGALAGMLCCALVLLARRRVKPVTASKPAGG